MNERNWAGGRKRNMNERNWAGWLLIIFFLVMALLIITGAIDKIPIAG